MKPSLDTKASERAASIPGPALDKTTPSYLCQRNSDELKPFIVPHERTLVAGNGWSRLDRQAGNHPDKKERENRLLGGAKAQTEIAGSGPRIGFQARIRTLESYRRAEAIDDAEVRQKPLFAGFPVPFDVLKSRVKIGVCSD